MNYYYIYSDKRNMINSTFLALFETISYKNIRKIILYMVIFTLNYSFTFREKHIPTQYPKTIYLLLETRT